MSDETPAAATAPAAAQKKRLRVAVLTRNFSPTAGGAERYAIALVEQLAAGHDITVFAQTIGHSWPNVAYRKISWPFKRPRWVNQLWFAGATWWATRKGFDIVHSHENTWYGNVQTVHVLPVRYNLFNGKARQQKLGPKQGQKQGQKQDQKGDLKPMPPGVRALKWLSVLSSPRLAAYLLLEHFRYAPAPGRRVVVTSQTLLDVFVACFPNAASSTSVVTPGIDGPPAGALMQSQASARQQVGLPQGVSCLLFVANDFKKKGLRTLMEALGLLPSNVVLAVVGASKHIASFEEQAASAGLRHRVFFLGALRDIGPAYLSATCLVHPTREDTFAMVVLEAMAYGLPVIVSNSNYCGIAALLEHQKNAMLLANPFDAQALANTIRSVLEDGLLKSNLISQARSFAEKFDWSSRAEQQELIYLDCVHAAGKQREQSKSPE